MSPATTKISEPPSGLDQRLGNEPETCDKVLPRLMRNHRYLIANELAPTPPTGRAGGTASVARLLGRGENLDGGNRSSGLAEVQMYAWAIGRWSGGTAVHSASNHAAASPGIAGRTQA